MSFGERLKNAWNAFTNKNPPDYAALGGGYYYRPDRMRFSRGNERSIVTAVYNRVALDIASVSLKHVALDDSGRFLREVNSGLNRCLTLEANLDQTGRAFLQDIVMSMLDEGCVAVLPTDTSINPRSGSYDILTMRTGKIIEWHPEHIKVRVYNEHTGQREELYIRKTRCAIIENPLFAVINEPNSTMQRLIRKLNILDAIDEQSGSGKLDLIIQLPYAARSEIKKELAEQRRQDIENQLAGSKLGIAYTDATEHITQLNRPIENNLMSQIEYLTSMLYSQLGITKEIMNGTADDKAMQNYQNRTLEPILCSIADEFKRKFLTDKARKQGESIEFYSSLFRLVPVSNLAEIADKFTRNEIMTSNEIRQVIGMKPSDDPKADQLRNSNISAPNGNEPPPENTEAVPEESGGSIWGQPV